MEIARKKLIAPLLLFFVLALPGKTGWSENDDEKSGRLWEKIEAARAKEDKSPAVLQLLTQFISQYPGHGKIPEALFREADILFAIGATEEALKKSLDDYKRVFTDFPDSEFAPESLFNTAEYCYHKDNRLSAVQYYEQLVVKYPQSEFAAQSRLFIDWIKAETPEDLEMLKKLYTDLSLAAVSVIGKELFADMQINRRAAEEPGKIIRIRIAYKSPQLFMSVSENGRVLASFFYGNPTARVYLPELDTCYFAKIEIPPVRFCPVFWFESGKSGKITLRAEAKLSSVKRDILEVIKTTYDILPRLHFNITEEKGRHIVKIRFASEGLCEFITASDFRVEQAEFVSEDYKNTITGFTMDNTVAELFVSGLGAETKFVELTEDNLVTALEPLYDAYLPDLGGVDETLQRKLENKESFIYMLKAIQFSLKSANRSPKGEWLISLMESFYSYLESHLDDVKDRVARKKIEQFLTGEEKQEAINGIGVLETMVSSILVNDRVYEDAIRDLSAKINADPGNAVLLFKRANTYKEKNEFGLAVEDVDRIIAIQPDDDSAYAVKAEIFFRKSISLKAKKYAETAREYAEKSLSLNPDNYRALNTMGRIYAASNLSQKENIDKSTGFFLKALKVKQDFLPACCGLAELLMKTQNFSAAFKVLQKAKQDITADSPEGDVYDVYYYLSFLYIQLNEGAKAISELNEFMERYPNGEYLPDARLYIFFCKAKLGEPKPADPVKLTAIAVKELEWIENIISANDADINVGNAALMLAQQVSPDMDISDYMKELDYIADEIKSRIGTEKDPEKIIGIINDYLFNFRKAYIVKAQKEKYIKTEMGRFSGNPSGSFLHNVLDTMEGNCMGFSTLYLAIGERLDLPLYGVALPSHVFVRYDDGNFKRNIETTNKGAEMKTLKEYGDFLENSGLLESDAEDSPAYHFSRNLSKKEFIALILINRGFVFDMLEQTGRAIESFEQSLRLRPDAPAGFFCKLGNLYLKAFDLSEDAVKTLGYFQKAAELGDAGAKATLNNILSQLRRNAEIENDTHVQYLLGTCYRLGLGVPKNKEECFKWVRKSAEQLNFDAWFTLGMCYYKGNGVERNAKEAVRWWRKVTYMEEKEISAHKALGICYLFGNGVERNESEAVKLLRVAAEQGDQESIRALSGIGTRMHFSQRINMGIFAVPLEEFIAKAEAGDPQSQFFLTVRLLNDDKVNATECPVEYDKVMKWMRKSAEGGNSDAQYLLGDFYAAGDGNLEKDDKKGFDWTKKSAEQGNKFAQYKLASLYMEGIGIAKDEKLALDWLFKSAKQDMPAAQYLAGIYYINGVFGVEKDPQKGLEWLEKAAEQKHLLASTNIGKAWLAGLTGEKDPKKAVKWFKKAVEDGGCPEAELNLGVCFCNGTGVDADVNEAYKWFSKSAYQGNPVAQYNLGLFYLNGIAVAQDKKEAVKWFMLSCQQGVLDAEEELKALQEK
ncbi:MAG: SEL1-like repeat protein [Planctomycetes bacterium]|nr:SEL1-like repeat protein [Planctomycetota bacterium]